MTLSKYALMQQASIGPFDTLSMYYILLLLSIVKFNNQSHPFTDAICLALKQFSCF